MEKSPNPERDARKNDQKHVTKAGKYRQPEAVKEGLLMQAAGVMRVKKDGRNHSE
jgi:hypothetical protein